MVQNSAGLDDRIMRAGLRQRTPMRPIAACTVLAIACLVGASKAQSPASAQVPRPTVTAIDQTTSGSLGGVVVDGTTGEPLANVVVTTCNMWEGPPRGQEARTDSEGRFTFSGLPPGGYNVCLKKGLKYLPEYMRVDEVGPGEVVRDVVKRVWRGASLDGRVLDERGEPAAGVRI